MQHDAVAVIDFGGQYAHLIANKVRRLGVLAEIRQPEDPIEVFERYKGIILSGSPSFASQGEDSDYTRAIFDLDIPIVGFCFGHQQIAEHYGGSLVHGGREWGKAMLHIVGDSPIFKGLGEVEQVFMSHYDSVVSVGPGFEEIGFSKKADGQDGHRFAAIANEELKRYGFQYHPEVDDTLNGETMFRNFVIDICGCSQDWNMEGFLDEEIARIQQQVGADGSVFLLASGGVDSTVAAAILGKALGPERLLMLHIDNGLMRKNESAEVVEAFEEVGLGKQLHFVDASEVFLEALKGVIEPERKRAIIGNTFIAVFEAEAKRLGIEDHLLGQGTIYPDTIETGGSKRADTIKTHHNRVPLIDEMIAAGKVVEPLADLYKVEVRELGEKLGVPHDLVWRHPFPGPGLGVRCLCSDGKRDDEGLDAVADQLAQTAEHFGIGAQVLPIRSVGVKADLRAYEHPVLLHGDADWNTLIEATSVITADIPGLNRCIWNLGPEMPSEVRPVKATMNRRRLDVLREADAIVMDALRRHGLYAKVWQCPTVLVPIEFVGGGGQPGGELIVVRPVHSARAMTATPVDLPGAVLADLRRQILKLDGVSGLAVDVTSKPPGTIEWE
ncbi:MAG: glutamine-hydrolyzing GMP synthase [Acidobacteria bacterium]|nr:glutamine-hydrolyzing GMP synthase [Acidobacteriota bacterium]